MSVDLERRISTDPDGADPEIVSHETARQIIEGIWDGWYGKRKFNMNSEEMCALLQKAKEEIISALIWAYKCPITKREESAKAIALDTNATTAFQRLPDDLAKLLNYGAPLNAEMLNTLAAAWNQKSSPQWTIPDNELLEKIALTLCLANCPACKGDATKCAYGIENYGEDAKQVLETIRPYLRSPAQVPKP